MTTPEDWKTDADAAYAEAVARILAARDASTPAAQEVLDLSDLPALTRVPEEIAEVTGLRRVFLGGRNKYGSLRHTDSRLSEITALSGLSHLREIDLSDTLITHIAPLAGLSALQSLILSDTQIIDVTPLEGLSALQSLNLSGTQITDITPLEGLSALQSLDLSYTQITDISPLAGLSALQRLNLQYSRITDLSPLLSIPAFAEERAASLRIGDTPVVDPSTDRRLYMLSRLDPKRSAIETVQYLKGTHPDFRDPPGGAVAVPLQARLAQASDVALDARDGPLEARNPAPPERLSTAETTARLAALRAFTAQMLDEANTKQLPRLLCARFEAYATALATDPPTYLMLDGPMTILKGARGDEFVTGPLDAGFLAGWSHLIAQHDALRPFLLPPDTLDDLPDPQPDTTPEAAEAITDDVLAVLEDGHEAGAVGQSVIDAMTAAKDYFDAAKPQTPSRALWLKRGLAAVGGITAGIVGATGFAAGLADLHLWAATAEGQALIARLTPLLERILQLFGGG